MEWSFYFNIAVENISLNTVNICISIKTQCFIYLNVMIFDVVCLSYVMIQFKVMNVANSTRQMVL